MFTITKTYKVKEVFEVRVSSDDSFSGRTANIVKQFETLEEAQDYFKLMAHSPATEVLLIQCKLIDSWARR